MVQWFSMSHKTEKLPEKIHINTSNIKISTNANNKNNKNNNCALWILFNLININKSGKKDAQITLLKIFMY